MKPLRWCSLMIALLVGCSGSGGDGLSVLPKTWSGIEFSAKGSMVRFYMNSGQDDLTQWIDHAVAEEMKRRYDITLVCIPLDTTVVVAKLVAEKERNMNAGGVDLFLVSGEDFRTAREADVLFGPFAEKLPNFIKYADKISAATDSGYPVDGYEVPLTDTHFMAIPKFSPNRAGAMVVANFLLLPEARE